MDIGSKSTAGIVRGQIVFLWLLRFVTVRLFPILIGCLCLSSSILLYAGIHVRPAFFRWAVTITAWLLANLDGHIGNRLARNPIGVLLLAGAFWGLVAYLVSIVLGRILGLRPSLICAPVIIAGIVIGLASGRQVLALPSWGAWAIEDGLQIGEDL